MRSSHGVLCLHIRRFLCYTAKSSKVVSYSFAVATYPREGTEISGNSQIEGIKPLQLIPARGRKNQRRKRAYAYPILPLQLIPARGRKHGRACGVLGGKVATYPCEGTETLMLAASLCIHALQLIPARGRKRFAGFPQVDSRVATYPREGTETASLSRTVF